MPTSSEVFRERLREVRRARDWTQQQLADALTAVGVELTPFTLNRVERGKRGVSLDEAVAIAAVLGPSLLHMIVPLKGGRVDLTPEMAVRAVDARAWLRGQRPLQQADEQLFYFQAPPSEADWFPFVPGPWRFENREHFEDTRDKWEREILRRGALPRTRDLQYGHDAEDIEVARPPGTQEDHDRDQEETADAIVTESNSREQQDQAHPTGQGSANDHHRQDLRHWACQS